jgi:glycosyltransferase involved in cell wall biosynthesis
VACSTSGGAAEVIAAAKGGILYREQKSSALAEALQSTFQLPEEEATRLVENGRAWLANNCHPKRCCEIFANLLKQACGLSPDR